MTTRNHIIAFIFLTLIGNFSTLNAQILAKKIKAKEIEKITSKYTQETESYKISSHTVPSALGIELLVEKPLKDLTIEQRTELLVRKIFWNPNFAYSPLILKEAIVSEDENYTLEKNDMIFSIIGKKNKLEKVTLNNAVRKLSKGKGPIDIFVFRKDQFLIKKWSPKKDFKFYSLENDDALEWKLHAELVEVILKSGAVNWNHKDTQYLVNPLRRLVEWEKFYYKPILDLFMKYGADLNWNGGINGMTALHYAAGANSHRGCSIKAHDYKKNLHSRSFGSQQAYYDLIAYGANDGARMGKPHKIMGNMTPKQFYFLTFGDSNHVNKESSVDWGAVANAVVAGVGAAVQEKQRQVQETQQINRINQAYQARIDAGIEAQRQQVAKNNAEYLARMQGGQPQTATSVENTITSSNNSSGSQTNQNDIPGYTNRQNIELNAGRNPASNLSSTNNTNPPTTNEERMTYYAFRASLLDPNSLKDVPYNLDDTRRVVNYRDQWVLNLRPIPNSLEEEWYPQLKKVEIVEIQVVLPTEQIQYKKDQIRSSPRQFLTYQGALGEIKPNLPRPPYWTLGEAQREAYERNRQRQQ